MSGFTMPRFAKTSGKSLKVSENEVGESPKTSSPSFFRSLKDKLGRTTMSQSFDREDPENTEDKSYFSKTAGTATMARNISAFAWVRSSCLEP